MGTVDREADREAGKAAEGVVADAAEVREVIVRASGLSASCTFSCPSLSSVRDVKSFIEKETDIPSRELRVCFQERELKDSEKLIGITQPDDLCELELSFLRRDPEQARWLEAVMQDPDGSFLAEAPSSIRDDGEVVLAAVMQNGRALQFASDRLRSDRFVVLQALEEDSSAFKFAATCLHANRDVMLAAVHRNGLTLESAVRELQGDRELVSAAVCQNGMALRFASEVLQADRKIVSMAVENDCNALQFAAKELQSDRELQDMERR